jgi:hypothetical protein
MILKVLYLDGRKDDQGDIILQNGMILPEGRIPVTFGYSDKLRDHMGSAELTLKEGILYADIDLLLNWQNNPGLHALTPAVTGIIMERNEEVVTKCQIKTLGLFLTKNVDKRILSIGEQLCH